jgi:DNA replication protein DnaC
MNFRKEGHHYYAEHLSLQVHPNQLKKNKIADIQNFPRRITINSALNLPFADWGKIFDSTSVATAIADRLVHNSQIFILEGPSYRKRTKKNT